MNQDSTELSYSQIQAQLEDLNLSEKNLHAKEIFNVIIEACKDKKISSFLESFIASMPECLEQRNENHEIPLTFFLHLRANPIYAHGKIKIYAHLVDNFLPLLSILLAGTLKFKPYLLKDIMLSEYFIKTVIDKTLIEKYIQYLDYSQYLENFKKPLQTFKNPINWLLQLSHETRSANKTALTFFIETDSKLVNVADHGSYPLHRTFDDPEACELLLQAGATPNVLDSNEGNTPLFICVAYYCFSFRETIPLESEQPNDKSLINLNQSRILKFLNIFKNYNADFNISNKPRYDEYKTTIIDMLIVCHYTKAIKFCVQNNLVTITDKHLAAIKKYYNDESWVSEKGQLLDVIDAYLSFPIHHYIQHTSNSLLVSNNPESMEIDEDAKQPDDPKCVIT